MRGLATPRERLRWLIEAALATFAVAALVYLPVTTGPNPFGNLSAHQDLFTTSFAAIGVFLVREVVNVASAQMLVLRISLVLFAGVLLWILAEVRAAFASLTGATFLAFLALLLIATIWFQAWYLVWMLALAPLAPPDGRAVAGLFSATALAIYLVYDFALFWAPWFFTRDDGLTMNVLTVGLVFGPPLLLLVLQRFRGGSRPLRNPGAEWPAGQHDLVGSV
jgi:hypothetical protein